MKKFWQVNKRMIKFVLLLFIFWQIAINVVSFVSAQVLPLREGFNYIDPTMRNPVGLWNRANFDGVHYLNIAKNGYGVYEQAFFPLYPRLIRFFSQFFDGKELIAGIFISNFALLVSLFLFYKIVLLDWDEVTAKSSLVFLLLFPTAFFFGMVYTESVFLLLVLGCFYAARKRNWFMAGVLGGLASYTRLVGIFLLPALLIEWWQTENWEGVGRKWEKLVKATPIFFAPLGLLWYMRFLWQKYGDPLMFVHVQPFFGAERSGGKIILLYQVFWRYLKMILTTKSDVLYFVVWLELLMAIFFLFLMVFSYKEKIRLSYLVFSVIAFLTPSLSGTFSSMPRYVLVLFPIFIYLGRIKNPLLKKIVYAIFVFLEIVCASLFLRGYWVA